MINLTRFSLQYQSSSIYKDKYNILLCGTLDDINEYQQEMIEELASVVDGNFYVRLDENKLCIHEVKDFNLYIYLISKRSLNIGNNERYIYDVPRYCVNSLTICMDEYSYQRLSIDKSNNILIRHGLYSKNTYLKLLKQTLNNNFISNEYLKDMNESNRQDLSFASNLAMWFGINHVKDVKKAFVNFYQGDDINSDLMSCYLDYSNFDEAKEIYAYYDENHDLNAVKYLKEKYEDDKNFQNFRNILVFLNMKFKKFGSKFTRTYFHDDEMYDFIKFYLDNFDLYREYVDDTLNMFINIVLAKIRGSIFEENEVDITKIIKSASKVVDYTRLMPYWNARILIEFGMAMLEHGIDHDHQNQLIDNTVEQIESFSDEYLSYYYFANLNDLLSKPMLKGDKRGVLLKYLNNAIHYYEKLYEIKSSFRNCLLLMMMYENALYKTIEADYQEYHTPLYEKYTDLVLKNYHGCDDFELIKNVLDFSDELMDLEDEIDINIKYETYHKLKSGLLKLIKIDDISNHPRLLKEAIRLYRFMIYDGYLNKTSKEELAKYSENYHKLLGFGANICLFDDKAIKDIEDFNQVLSEINLYNDFDYQKRYIEEKLSMIFTNIAKYACSIDIYKKACSHTYSYMEACLENDDACDINYFLDKLDKLANEMNNIDKENHYGDEWLAKIMYLRCTYHKAPPYDVETLLKAKDLLMNLRDRAYEGYLNVIIEDIDEAIFKSSN